MLVPFTLFAQGCTVTVESASDRTQDCKLLTLGRFAGGSRVSSDTEPSAASTIYVIKLWESVFFEEEREVTMVTAP